MGKWPVLLVADMQRRAFVRFGAAALASAQAAPVFAVTDNHLGPFNPNETYLLETGDGTPEYLHVAHEVRLAEAHWFSVRLAASRRSCFGSSGPSTAAGMSPRHPEAVL